jgi:phosphoglycerate dehydrogenase-like enzyme
VIVLVGIYSPFAGWNIPDSHVERLRSEFPRHTFLHAASDERALELIPPAQVAFMSELRPAHLAAAPRLQWVHSAAAGVGGMLFPAMIESPVVMSNSRGISADTIAEHVLAVTLAMFRKLPLAFRTQSERQWAQDAMVESPGLRTIADSRVLLVGLGAIGSATARRLVALGAHVTAIRRNPARPAPNGVEAVAPPERLRELLPGADVVVIAAPQTRDTRRLIGAAELAAMRRDALLINVSRGKLLDEAALVSALGDTPTLGAALDVFETEPLPADSPLWSLPNVLITPHISGFRPDHWDAVTNLFADNLRRFESGRALLNVVNKEAGY